MNDQDEMRGICAALAMNGYLASHQGFVDPEYAAMIAVQCADALLRRLAVPAPPPGE